MRSILFTASAALVLGACEPVATVDPPAEAPVTEVTPPAPPPPTPERLEDANWRLTELFDQPTPNRVVLEIAGQFITGELPCNQVSGNYLGTGPIFNVQVITTTSLSCGVATFEDTVLKNLLEARSATIDEDGTLRVLAPDGLELLEFQPFYPDL